MKQQQDLWTIDFDYMQIVVCDKWVMPIGDENPELFFLDNVIDSNYVKVNIDSGTPDNPFSEEKEIARSKDNQWYMMTREQQSELIREFFETFRHEFEDYTE